MESGVDVSTLTTTYVSDTSGHFSSMCTQWVISGCPAMGNRGLGTPIRSL